MKQVKFRAWDKQNLKWVKPNKGEGFTIWANGRGIADVPRSWNGSENPDNFILLQYTGLKDKNGVEIYEGDIIEFPNGSKHEVIWRKGTFCYQESENSFHIFDETKCKIIGNIYENPNLLKE